MSRLWCLLISLLMWSGPSMAGNDNPFRVETADAKLEAGAKGKVQVIVRVPDNHHLYRDMMNVTVVAATGVETGEASFPPGHEKPDPADPSSTREQYDMDVLIDVPVTAPKVSGTYPMTLEVRYQGCKKSLCWMPQTETVEASVNVMDAAK